MSWPTHFLASPTYENIQHPELPPRHATQSFNLLPEQTISFYDFRPLNHSPLLAQARAALNFTASLTPTRQPIPAHLLTPLLACHSVDEELQGSLQHSGDISRFV